MQNLPLFDPPSPTFDREGLASALHGLAKEGVYVGTSSWKYEGWIGQVYSQAPYMVRGRFSKKRFEENCLGEYGQTFPVVCGDFSFYQFPAPEFWAKLFAGAPPPLRFAFKVPEEVTCKTFPSHPRHGPRAGQPNDTYLNHHVFAAGFLDAIAPWRDRVAVLIFEFGTFSKKSYAAPDAFFADLDAFLTALPRGWKYAVEIRNEDYLRQEYFEVLRRHGVAHVFTSWTRMPPLYKQIEIAEAWTADFTVVRALLRPGRPYETAVQMFSPYEKVQDKYPGARDAMRTVIECARKRREPAYLFINNRLEGNAPVTIANVVTHEDD